MNPRMQVLRKFPRLLAGLVLALAFAPAAMAQDGFASAAPGGAVSASQQVAFRIVIHDVVRVEDGHWEQAGQNRAAHQPRFQVREDAVDGRSVLTIAQP